MCYFDRNFSVKELLHYGKQVAKIIISRKKKTQNFTPIYRAESLESECVFFSFLF